MRSRCFICNHESTEFERHSGVSSSANFVNSSMHSWSWCPVRVCRYSVLSLSKRCFVYFFAIACPNLRRGFYFLFMSSQCLIHGTTWCFVLHTHTHARARTHAHTHTHTRQCYMEAYVIAHRPHITVGIRSVSRRRIHTVRLCIFICICICMCMCMCMRMRMRVHVRVRVRIGVRVRVGPTCTCTCSYSYMYQSRGQFLFCNSIPIPVISIPIQFRLRYKIPKAIQFQFR